MRRGVLMTMLQQAASQLPMMIGKSSERWEYNNIGDFISIAPNIELFVCFLYYCVNHLSSLFLSPPPLCGAIQADNNYVAHAGDHVRLVLWVKYLKSLTREWINCVVGPRNKFVIKQIILILCPCEVILKSTIKCDTLKNVKIKKI